MHVDANIVLLYFLSQTTIDHQAELCRPGEAGDTRMGLNLTQLC